MKNWEGENFAPEKFSTCLRTIPVCPHLLGAHALYCLPVEAMRHACCDHNESESYRPTILSADTVLNSRHIRYFSPNFSQTIGGEAIEQWEGKDLFSPPCIEI